MEKTTIFKEILFFSKIKDCIFQTFQTFTFQIFTERRSSSIKNIFSYFLVKTLEISKYLFYVFKTIVEIKDENNNFSLENLFQSIELYLKEYSILVSG